MVAGNDYVDMIMTSRELVRRAKKILESGETIDIPNNCISAPFAETEADAIYSRCVTAGCLWQDIPEVVERVKKWEEECQKLKDEGALF